jgi:Mor family transcriptional regulator
MLNGSLDQADLLTGFESIPDSEIVAALPKEATELLGAIPLPAVLKVIETYGGRRVRISRKGLRRHPLAKVLGHETLERLAVHVGSGCINVPKGAALMRMRRDHAIEELRRAGTTIGELASRYRLTEREIYNILARYGKRGLTTSVGA